MGAGYWRRCLGKRILTVSTALAVLQLTAKGLCAVPVEQIEAYNPYAIGTTLDPYAPVNFSGSSSLTVGWGALGGAFSDITFHADMATGNANTVSGHAQTVGDYFYGQYQSTAFSYVTNVYDESAQDFLTIVLDPAGATGIGPLPGSFAGGAEVINNSYVASQGSTSALLDDDRRMDYMINAADVVWVSSAVTGGTGFTVPQYLAWSNFNGLAVSGIQDSQQFFNPAGSPGKQHADISIPTTDASFASAIVSGYATALWGNAQANNQIDAEHGVVIRSLLMAGADKYSYAYTRPTNTSSGALDPINGAGQADYDSSLAILEGGEKSLLIGGAAGPIATTQSGWASGNISAGTQSVVLFQSSSPLYGLTASLNWNVTSPLAGTSSLNTAAVLFPNLTLEVRPAIYNFTSHQYVLGAPESDTTLNSAVVGDNVQYLYSTSTLLPGSYAFLIGGDPALTATVGFSYTLQGSFASKWNGSGGGGWTSPANWTNGVPNGDAAHVIIATPSGTTTPATINLNGDVTIGQLTLGNSYGDTIAQGTGGTLRIDETGDTVNNSAITVVSGNQIISAPMHFDWGLNTTIPGGASLNISGGLSGYSSGPNLVKNGTGLLLLNGTISYGGTTINAGTFTFGANTGTGFLVRTNALTVNAGAAATLAPTTVSSNRQLLISSGLTIAGGPGLWTGLLDLANNDLDVPGGNLQPAPTGLRCSCGR